MIRLDLAYFLRLATQLSRLRNLSGTVGSSRALMNEARAWLGEFQQERLFGSFGFRTARNQVPGLLSHVDHLIAQGEDYVFDWGNTIPLFTALSQFENALQSEASVADAYYVLEKRPYSTITLVTEGETLFPPKTMAKVPEAQGDLREAGKCIAFELPTAAAFHIHRATEAVLRRYWAAVTGGAARPKVRSMGVYLAALKKNGCGDSKVIAALTQMTELHRNPTMHPEDTLTLDETIALLGMANSVVAAMLKEIPDVVPEQREMRLPMPGTNDEPEHQLIEWGDDGAAK
ncbi:MAG: hypothetical protein V4499_06220 [Pseudomonadota bacterium]